MFYTLVGIQGYLKTFLRVSFRDLRRPLGTSSAHRPSANWYIKLVHQPLVYGHDGAELAPICRDPAYDGVDHPSSCGPEAHLEGTIGRESISLQTKVVALLITQQIPDVPWWDHAQAEPSCHGWVPRTDSLDSILPPSWSRNLNYIMI